MRNGWPDDPFHEPEGTPRVLWGAAVLTGSLQVAELAGRIGFDSVWIETEHGGAGYGDVERLCMAAGVGGAVPTVRLPNHLREHVLRALEAGGRILVAPMIDDAEAARDLVRRGKFPPLGERGFNSRSRGVGYGLLPATHAFDFANRSTHLFAQIETREAVRNLDRICAVQGLAGVFLGPGDLSAALGKTAQFTDGELIEIVAGCIRRARSAGKHAGILCAPGPLLTVAREAGADLIFCAGDINDLTSAWKALLAGMKSG